MKDYQEFIRSKAAIAEESGFPCSPDECHAILKRHQRDIVAWSVRGGRRAIFAAFGLGKTVMQLEIVRLVLEKSGGGRGLIVAPLGVRQEFKRDAEMLGLSITFIREIGDAQADGIYITNYESIREGKLDPSGFTVVSLDEAGILRGFGGTKTFRELMARFEGTSIYRFVATATPSPNEYIELLAYAAFLDVMDVGQAKTRFFKRDSTHADKLTLHAHKAREFWLWVSSWAIFLQKPSDIGHSDDGYILPPIDVRWHEIPSDHSTALPEASGQAVMFSNAAIGVSNAAAEKRSSLYPRIEKLMEIRAEDPTAHRLIWHDLEAERTAIERAIPGAATVYGSQDKDAAERIMLDFADGKIQELGAKPSMLGAGCNFQRHCAHAIFLGVSFKFFAFIQAIHRIQRFLQTRPVRIDIIYTEAERGVRAALERKWEQHNEMVAAMAEIIRDYGLSTSALASTLRRSIGVERVEESGRDWKLVNNDSVDETARMEPDSVGLILTSIPFSTQYEYSPSYNDFGHNEDAEAFWSQMDYLTPHLLRVLQPGRVCAIHVKDRITPGGITGLGFQTVSPLHAEAIFHYRRHGFAYLGMKTITTDVVRENNQTYRLGWTEQCKDGSRMGCGMPEYLLLFRKPPSDASDGYADVPVSKPKEEYSLGRWQVDAAGDARSSGNRLISPEDLEGIPHHAIYKLWRQDATTRVYDFRRHVALCDSLKERRILPVTFQLLPPHSWHPDVWSDITRMRTLNGAQSAKGKEMHLCPMQFDVAERAITQFSMPGELVFDPFAGLGTVPMVALQHGRRGSGCELSPAYFVDSVFYLRQAEQRAATPTLFDLAELEASA